MKKLVLIIFLSFYQLSTIPINGQNKEIDLLKENYRNQILKPSVSPTYDTILARLYQIPKETYFSDQIITDLMQYYPSDSLQIQQILNQIDENGRWNDIDYDKKNRSRWYPQEHAERIYLLSSVYNTESSPFYQSTAIEQAFHKTLNWWFEAKLKSPNWWHNQIGVPKLLGSAMLLLEEEMTEEEIQKGILYLSKSKIGKYTGQNKVWLAGINFAEALLSNDIAKAKEARNQIIEEIVIADKEGIKRDNSFQQHGAMLQFANYGGAFIVSNGFWGKVFNNTSLAIEQEKLDILANFLIGGYGKVVYNGFLDTGVLARQYFHNTQTHKGIALLLNALYFSEIDQKNSSSYQNFIATNISKNPKPTGVYHFWLSDYTVVRYKDWMASVRMASTRVKGGESLNGDNKQGYYTGDGATFIYKRGDEYLNIFPNWEWKRLPGVTCYNSSNEPIGVLDGKVYRNNSSFVGNVNCDEYGISAMHLQRDGLHANKFWLMSPDFILCLGNSIATDSICDVTTSIEQNINREPLLMLNKNKWLAIDSISISNTKKDTRFYHDETGYIIFDKQNVVACTKSSEGKWNEIMNIYPKNYVNNLTTNNIWINHGQSPKNSEYAYLLLPNIDKERLKEFDTKSIKIIRNDNTMQIVAYKDKYFIASEHAIDLKISKKLQVSSNIGGLFIVSKKSIYYADPTQKEDNLQISINGINKIISLDLQEKGKSITID